MAFLESVLSELEKVGGYRPGSAVGASLRAAQSSRLAAPTPKPAAAPATKKRSPAPFDMRQDTLRKAMAKRYEEKAPGRPWYKHPAAMIGGGALAGYATSRLLNRDE